MDQVSVDPISLDHAAPGAVAATHTAEQTGTATRHRAAVPVFVCLVGLTAIACLVIAGSAWSEPFPLAVLGFMAMATVADLREVRLPGVGVITLSFVPTLATLIVFGIWPAMLVAAVSGGGALWLTRDPLKVTLNIGNFVLATFLAGHVYEVLVGQGDAFSTIVLPAYAYAGLDFLITTTVLATVISLSTGERPANVWRTNYQWGITSYLTGASLALLVAWLYLQLGLPGLLLGLPPLFLIYYSYDIYVTRARERASHKVELASFRQELAASEQLHDELRTAQRRVAAEIERARRIQIDLLPQTTPQVAGLEIAHRIAFLSEMGGDYFDFVPYRDGRLGIVCGDVMGKGLAAALIMAMARSVVHEAAAPGGRPGEILHQVNDSLARDLEGQQLPYFLTAVYLLYDPVRGTLTLANAGHNPVLHLNATGVRHIASQGPMLGVRPNLDFPEDTVAAAPGDVLALFTDGITETRRADGEQFGVQRLSTLLFGLRHKSLEDILQETWRTVDIFREGNEPTDDATLLLVRLSETT